MLFVLLLLAGLAVASPTPSPGPGAAVITSGATSTKYLIVPLGEPGSESKVEDDATSVLVDELRNRGYVAETVAVMDHLQAVSQARTLCGAHSAQGIFVGHFSYDQTPKQNGLGFIPIVGRVFTLSGVDKRTPTRVHLNLAYLKCDGTVAWNDNTVGDYTARGNNPISGVTAAFRVATTEAIADFQKSQGDPK